MSNTILHTGKKKWPVIATGLQFGFAEKTEPGIGESRVSGFENANLRDVAGEVNNFLSRSLFSFVARQDAPGCAREFAECLTLAEADSRMWEPPRRHKMPCQERELRRGRNLLAESGAPRREPKNIPCLTFFSHRNSRLGFRRWLHVKPQPSMCPMWCPMRAQ